jgi:hypothetical protein
VYSISVVELEQSVFRGWSAQLSISVHQLIRRNIYGKDNVWVHHPSHRDPWPHTRNIIPLPALVRAGLERLPAMSRAQGERASRPFFRILYRQHYQPQRADGLRAVKRFFDWCDDHHLGLENIEPIAVAAYIE